MAPQAGKRGMQDSGALCEACLRDSFSQPPRANDASGLPGDERGVDLEATVTCAVTPPPGIVEFEDDHLNSL